MLYSFIKKAGKQDASLDRYWIEPSGMEHYVGNYTGTHMQWIFNNQHVLQGAQIDAIKKGKYTEETIEKFAGAMYQLGWVRISENVVLMHDNAEMPTLAGFISRHEDDPNLKVEGFRLVTIFTIASQISRIMKVSDILESSEVRPTKLVASLNQISSRDAVKDTIEYWDKAKNKDFSKYWRKLRRNKKKANYIPNPDTTVPQPLKRNYDYGEIPNYVDRLKWFNRKHKQKKRKASLRNI